MKVLLLNPPFLPRFSRSQRSPAVTKSGTLYYPLWLAYAAGALEQAGHQVRLIDAPAEGYNLGFVLRQVGDFQPGLAVVDTSTPSIESDVHVAEAIKEVSPETFVILVGPHVSALPEESLRFGPKVDAVARREYDYTLSDLARALEEGDELQAVKGLSFRGEGGLIVHNPDRPLIKDLDALPLVSQVYKKHLKIEHYFYAITRHPVIAIITGRGCPYRCIYCVYPQTMHGHRYRYRSVENVVAEFEYITQELPQVREIFIEDDTLTVNRKRCRELSQRIIEKGLHITWTANSRADVDYETLKLMKEAGCRLLCVGFESGEQRVLDNIKKQITLEQIRRFVEDAKRAGILIHGCFMVGNPGDTGETLHKTLELAKELNPDTVQFFPLMVYPGTEAYEWAVANGYLTAESYSQWLTPGGLHNCVISQPGLTAEELVDFCDRARQLYYLRPSYIAMKLGQILTHPAEAKRTIKSLRTFLPYLLHKSLSFR